MRFLAFLIRIFILNKCRCNLFDVTDLTILVVINELTDLTNLTKSFFITLSKSLNIFFVEQ